MWHFPIFLFLLTIKGLTYIRMETTGSTNKHTNLYENCQQTVTRSVMQLYTHTS